ncbi:hypothetical protein [Nocardioides sp.]|uniref:hypothetical protein n=1 Tax=Nocardioides sp. TaxID=35761 RepID=UPI003D0C3F64
MTLIFTIVAAFPIGLLIKSRQAALLGFLIAGSFLFTLQSLNLLLTWMSGGSGLGGSSGFGDTPTGPFPVDFSQGEVMAYGIVNAIIFVAGIGLVLLGARVRARRTATGRPDQVVDVH